MHMPVFIYKDSLLYQYIGESIFFLKGKGLHPPMTKIFHYSSFANENDFLFGKKKKNLPKRGGVNPTLHRSMLLHLYKVPWLNLAFTPGR